MAGLFRSLLFIGFIALAVCDDEKKKVADVEKFITVEIDGQEQEKDTVYLTTSDEMFNVKCIAPADSIKDKNKFVLLHPNGTTMCEYGSGPCWNENERSIASSKPINFRSNNITSNYSFTCKFTGEHPPAKERNVKMYIVHPKGVQIPDSRDDYMLRVKVMNISANVSDPEIKGDFRVDNRSNYALLCPNLDGRKTEGDKVFWFRNGEAMIVKENPYYDINETSGNLTLETKTAKSLDATRYGGWYMCKRMNNGTLVVQTFKRIYSSAYVHAEKKAYNIMEDGDVIMSCIVEGEPTPVVTWKRQGRNELLNTTDPKISFQPKNGVPNASIRIKDLNKDDHYGDYECWATSPNGTSQAKATILLRVRSKLAALWPFLGIVAEVIVLVVIIFIYEKRRAKKEQEETEDTADQKKSLTASNNENKDIRQRKA